MDGQDAARSVAFGAVASVLNNYTWAARSVLAFADKLLASIHKTSLDVVRISFDQQRNYPRNFFKETRHAAPSERVRGQRGRDRIQGHSMSESLKTVAVVDDDPEMRSSLACLLGAVGYRAETYDSAETFLVCASSCKACCLIIDINLGDITGVELAYQLLADGLKWPIIFMSGHDDLAIKNQATALGPIAFLLKPFRANDLIDAIKKAIL